jgi:preprotein translocase subunit SecE
MAQYIENSKRFIREVRSEMSRVTWPNWLELKGQTGLVIFVSLFFAIYIWLVDTLLVFTRNLF